MNIKLLLENLKGRDHFGDLSIDWNIILKRILVKHCEVVNWIKLICDGVR